MKRGSIDRRSFLKISAALGGAAASDLSLWNVSDVLALANESDAAPTFVDAEPVWAKGRETEMNVSLVFFAAFHIDDENAIPGAILRATGSTIMRVSINSEFAGYGPARGPHGWFRVDEWDLSKYLHKGDNFLTIEIAGYNSNSYYLLDQPSFLQAEAIDGTGKTLAATSTKQKPDFSVFQAIDYTGVRVQKVQRFSFQRPFIEVYDLSKIDEFEAVELATQPEVKYLPRRVPYPEFAILKPIATGQTGKFVAREKLENPWRDRAMVNISDELKGYKLEELSIVLSDDILRLETTFDPNAKPLDVDATYVEGDVQIFDFGANYCGFFGFEAETFGQTEIAITFDEVLDPAGDVNFLRLGTCSAIKWTIGANAPMSKLEAFEPHVGRYAKIHCLKGSFKLKNFYMREYAYPEPREASFDCSDPRLTKIYKAAILTFRENSVDAFTDCPHRERAGWLCDSFFTARTAFDLTGKTDVEQTFFENYLLPESFKCLPDGMLPMCYPADHYDGNFIPNWAMWFVAQLDEYGRRSPDRSTIQALKKKVEKLFKFFEGYENSDGLLEKLPSWVFVEWSAANDFVMDVNYPSNMLYAYTLEVAGKLYNVGQWLKKAEAIRAKVREQSFDGEFFVDHATRQADGSLKIERDRSEICQYFAFFFKTATPESHPELWATLLDKFGPNRIKEGGYPEVHKANAFVGNVLRLELVAMAGRSDQLLNEFVAYNEYMVDRTGTLWENDAAYASCNHGFASHVARVLYRNILGFETVDPVNKKVVVKLPKVDSLDWASGVQPVPGGALKARWEKKDGKLAFAFEKPEDYEVEFINESGLELLN